MKCTLRMSVSNVECAVKVLAWSTQMTVTVVSCNLSMGEWAHSNGHVKPGFQVGNIPNWFIFSVLHVAGLCICSTILLLQSSDMCCHGINIYKIFAKIHVL